MSALRTLLLTGVFLLALPLVAWAEDIQFISTGQRYWWCGVFTDEEVTVTGVDRARNRVQVTRADGEVAWVAPDVLLTTEDRTKLVLERIKAGAAIINELAKNSTKSAPPAAAVTTVPGANEIRVCNNAASGAVSFALMAPRPDGKLFDFATRGWYVIREGTCTAIDQVPGTSFLYTAFSERGLQWRGDGSTMICVHPTAAFALGASSTCQTPYVARSFMHADVGTSRTLSLTAK